MKAKKVVPRRKKQEKWRDAILRQFASDEARQDLVMNCVAIVAILNVLVEGGNMRALRSLRGLGGIISQTVESHTTPRRK